MRLAELRLAPSHQLSVFGDARDPSPHFGHAEHSDELARDAIQHKRHAALVHVNQQLSHPPVHHAIHQDAFVGRIKIPNVIGDFLKMPAQFARVRIERHHARGIEVHVFFFAPTLRSPA